MHRLFLFLLVAQFLAVTLTMVLRLFRPAPYGRHHGAGWGPAVSSRAGWLLATAPSALVLPILYLASGRSLTDPAVIYLLLWEAHAVYRVAVFSPRLRGPRKDFPLALLVPAWLFHLSNGYINGYYLFFLPFDYGPATFLAFRAVAGLVLFAGGMALHSHADAVLRGLREPNTDSYAVPEKGLFRLVSNPNYLGELLQWAGWAVLTWNFPGLVSAWSVLCGVFPRALADRRWYRKRFPDYPGKRKALIPFLL